MRVFVVLNPHCGTIAGQDCSAIGERVAKAFRDHGVDATIVSASGDEIVPLVRRQMASAGYDAIVAGGGDGSINSVATVLAGGPVPLGVLPLGTFNHFARDLGLPLDIGGAARVIAEGRTRRIDVGEVNGRVFINNSSIGVYPELVADRQRATRRGWPKPVALALALARVVRSLPARWVRVAAPGWSVARRTPCLFVGNNHYALSPLSIATRSRLDCGELCVYVVNHNSRLGLLRLALRATLGRLRPARDFALVCAQRVQVEARRRRLRVAFDGETAIMTTPIEYRVRPAALAVFAPEPSP